MRIANKSFLPKQAGLGKRAFLLILLGSLPFTALAQAHAADEQPPAVGMPTAATTPMIAPPAAPAMLPNPGGPEAVKAQSADMSKNLADSEAKIDSNVKSVMKGLETSSDSVMLEELNSARQTVARIEAMIDIEKHMAELEKVRNERNHVSSTPAPSIVTAMPASVLQQPLPLRAAAPEAGQAEVEHHRSGGWEIARISGSDGKYVAFLRLADGDLKPVKTGDQIFNGTTVRAITSSSVEIEENGEPHTLHIKNVDFVYSAMR